MINIGGNIGELYIGSTKIAEAYIGNSKVYSAEPDVVIMTSETNAPMLAVCYAQGWAKHSDYMTLKEAQSVTSIGTVFRQNTSISSLQELQYFTGLTALSNNALRGMTAVRGRIYIPEGVKTLGSAIVAYNNVGTVLILPKTTDGL